MRVAGCVVFGGWYGGGECPGVETHLTSEK